MDYKQPDFYHFSEDSLKLVAAISSNGKHAPRSLLDIGTGCGVLAIECANKHLSIEEVVMLEVQNNFFEYIDFNITHLLEREVVIEKTHTSLSQFVTDKKFDLIVCNPPYFEKGTGRVSPKKEKQICRTFEIDSPAVYMEKIIDLLKPNGRGFILIPHNVDPWEKVLIKYSSRLKMIETLNGVSIYLIS